MTFGIRSKEDLERLAYPVIKLKYGNLVLGGVFIALGMLLKFVTVDMPWLLWLGLKPHGFYSLDYFPILPWFGVVLVGVFLGNSLYANYTRSFRLRDLSDQMRVLTFLGRHSLFIYLIHQPVLIAALYLLGVVDIGALACS